MTNDANLRLVVGTYARLKRPLAYVEGIPLYEWNCLVYYPGQPFLDLSPYIERVEFTLHPSFENPVRKVSIAPFGIGAEGWGEFPIIVEIFLKIGGSVKITHDLKLNVPEKIVVNETFDVIEFPPSVKLLSLTDRNDEGEFPVFSEYVSSGKLVDYTALENAYIAANLPILERLQKSVESLSVKALEAQIEWLSLLNKSTPSTNS